MTAARVLVVDDDSLQQEFLKAVLEKRGYVAETASDGLTAVNMMRSGRYSLALVDYQLPEIDGLASARLIHDLLPEEDRPTLIAVTANEASLRGRGDATDIFDAILRKPLDMGSLTDALDRHLRADAVEAARRAHEEQWKQVGLPGPPGAVPFPATGGGLQEAALRSCFDLSGSRPADLILLADPAGVDELRAARLRSDLFALPVVDLTGRFRDAADASFSPLDPNGWRAVAEAVGVFAERRAQLSPALSAPSGDPALRVLAYMFLSGRPLFPRTDERAPFDHLYPGFFPPDLLLACAERLADRGLAERLRVGRPSDDGKRPGPSAYTLTVAGLSALRTASAPLPAPLQPAPPLLAPPPPAGAERPPEPAPPPAGALPPALAEWLDAVHGPGPMEGAPPVILASLRYAGRDRCVAAGGEAGFGRIRQVFLDALARTLGADGVTHSENGADFVLIQNGEPSVLLDAVLRLRGDAVHASLQPIADLIDWPGPARGPATLPAERQALPPARVGA